MTKYLTKEEEYNLYKAYLIDNDLNAKDKIILNQTDLVKSIAYQFKDSEDFEDLVQEGMIATIKAFDKWSPDKGASFTTFNKDNVKYHLIKYINNNKPVKLPENKVADIKKIRKARETLDRINEPKTIDNISTMTGIDVHTINATLRAIAPTIALNKHDEDFEETVHSIKADRQSEPEYKLEDTDFLNKIDINILTDKQREILLEYIDNDYDVHKTAAHMNVNVAVINNNLHAGLKKLNKHYKKLKDINQAGSMWYQGKSYFEIAKKLKISYDEACNYVSIYYNSKI
jgi:RNA polymerase sigma factor (sigma-70 family)